MCVLVGWRAGESKRMHEGDGNGNVHTYTHRARKQNFSITHVEQSVVFCFAPAINNSSFIWFIICQTTGRCAGAAGVIIICWRCCCGVTIICWRCWSWSYWNALPDHLLELFNEFTSTLDHLELLWSQCTNPLGSQDYVHIVRAFR